MGDPQVGQGSAPLEFLETVPSKPIQVCGDIDHKNMKSVATPYQNSNANGVGSVSHPTTSTSIAAQPNPNIGSTAMSFQKLEPKSLSVPSRVSGTDYKP